MALRDRNGNAADNVYTSAGGIVDHVYDWQGSVVYSRSALPQITSFRSNPGSLLASVTNVANIDLSWTVAGADSITIRDAAGTTIHTSTDAIGMYRIATPAADTHWTITATNTTGSSTSRWDFYRTIAAVVSLLTSQISQRNPGGIPTAIVELSCRVVSHPWGNNTVVSISPERYGARAHSANRFFQTRMGATQREGVVAQLRRVVSAESIGTSTTYTVTALNALAPPASSQQITIYW